MESSVVSYLQENGITVEKKNNHFLLTFKGLCVGRYYPVENKMMLTRLPPVGEFGEAQQVLRTCRDKFHCKVEV